MHVETNLAFHFRRGNALDFQRTVLRFGELVPGLLLGFGSNGLGLELGLGRTASALACNACSRASIAA